MKNINILFYFILICAISSCKIYGGRRSSAEASYIYINNFHSCCRRFYSFDSSKIEVKRRNVFVYKHYYTQKAISNGYNEVTIKQRRLFVEGKYLKFETDPILTGDRSSYNLLPMATGDTIWASSFNDLGIWKSLVDSEVYRVPKDTVIAIQQYERSCMHFVSIKVDDFRGVHFNSQSDIFIDKSTLLPLKIMIASTNNRDHKTDSIEVRATKFRERKPVFR